MIKRSRKKHASAPPPARLTGTGSALGSMVYKKWDVEIGRAENLSSAHLVSVEWHQSKTLGYKIILAIKK